MTPKLLLDQNLSSRLLGHLDRHFPGSDHVRLLHLDTVPDHEIWAFAAENGFAIVSKDSDFHHLSALFGAPPKVVWLRAGNCSTDDILAILLTSTPAIQGFCSDVESALLVLE